MQSVVTETVGGELYHYYPLGQHIVRAPGGGCGDILPLPIPVLKLPAPWIALPPVRQLTRLLPAIAGR